MSHQLGISIQAAFRRLDRLVRAGYLGIRLVFPDKPLVIYVLTPQGKKAVEG